MLVASNMLTKKMWKIEMHIFKTILMTHQCPTHMAIAQLRGNKGQYMPENI